MYINEKTKDKTIHKLNKKIEKLYDEINVINTQIKNIKISHGNDIVGKCYNDLQCDDDEIHVLKIVEFDINKSDQNNLFYVYIDVYFNVLKSNISVDYVEKDYLFDSGDFSEISLESFDEIYKNTKTQIDNITINKNDFVNKSLNQQ